VAHGAVCANMTPLDPQFERRRRHSRIFGFVVVAAFVVAIGWYAWSRRPVSYVLRFSAGSSLSRRAELASRLEKFATTKRVFLRPTPMSGSGAVLGEISAGRLDVGLVQGGLPREGTPIRQVAILGDEVFHVFVKPTVLATSGSTHPVFACPAGLKVNIGAPGSGTRVLAEEVLDFMECDGQPPATRMELSYENLLTLPEADRPDVLFGVASLPWDFGQRIVAEWGYALAEIPFGEALALRDPGLHATRIPEYVYGVNPPVPATSLPAIGTRLYLVAREGVPEEAITRLMEVIHETDLARSAGLDEFRLEDVPRYRQYPLHAGTVRYLHRNDPLLDGGIIESAENLRSFLVSLAIAGVLLWRWRVRSRLVGFEAYLDRASIIENEALELERADALDVLKLQEFRRRLTTLKGEALDKHAEGKLTGEEHLLSFLAHVNDVRCYLESLFAHASRKESFRPRERDGEAGSLS
jgi:TRAP-type uncharacterized transport system substrate-binding protein